MGTLQGTPGCTGGISQVPAARGPGTRVGMAHVRVLQGPRSSCSVTKSGGPRPQAKAKEGKRRFGVALLLPAAPGERGGSARPMVGLAVTLKHYNHPCCALLNSAFLMPLANLRAPRGDSSRWHPVTLNPCRKEPPPPAWGHPSTTPCPPLANTTTPLGTNPPRGQLHDGSHRLQKPPPGEGFGSRFTPPALPPPAPCTAPMGDIQSAAAPQPPCRALPAGHPLCPRATQTHSKPHGTTQLALPQQTVAGPVR